MKQGPYSTVVSASLTPNTSSRPIFINSFPGCKESVPTVKLESSLLELGERVENHWNFLGQLSFIALHWHAETFVSCINSTSPSALTFHGCLQRIDGVDLGDDDSGSEAAQGLSAALAHISVTCHHGHFSSNHDICGTFDAVDERLSATIQVIKLALWKKKEQFQNRWKSLKNSLEKQKGLICKY